MFILTVIAVISSTVKVHAIEQQVSHAADADISTIHLLDALANRTIEAAPSHFASLDGTTLSKSGQPGILAHRTNAKPYIPSLPAIGTRGVGHPVALRASRDHFQNVERFGSFERVEDVKAPQLRPLRDSFDCRVGGLQLCGCPALVKRSAVRRFMKSSALRRSYDVRSYIKRECVLLWQTVSEENADMM